MSKAYTYTNTSVWVAAVGASPIIFDQEVGASLINSKGESGASPTSFEIRA